jgi:hypothetical protein
MDIEFSDRPLQVSTYLMWWVAYSGGTSEGYGASKAANDSPGAERRSGALHFLGHRQEYSHLAPQVCSFCTQPHSSSPCMHVILHSGFFFPQFCDVFVAVAIIHKRKEPNLATGQIEEEESKHFLQSCYDVFATFKKNQVSRLLPCFSPYQNLVN